MLNIQLGGSDIKSLLSAQGAIQVLSAVLQAGQPFSPGTKQLLDVSFETGPAGELPIGVEGSATLEVTAKTSASLTVYTSNSDAADLTKFGLSDYFTKNPGQNMYLMVLNIGGSGDASAGASFQYKGLQAGVTLGAGVNALFGQTWAFPAATPADNAIRDFLKQLQLPAATDEAPRPGDCRRMEYGGYLSFGSNLGVGYAMTGSSSQDIGSLKLSENYKLNFLGKLAMSSKVAGQFVIMVSAGARPGWARIQVNKSRSKNFQTAANIDMGGGIDVQGLPDNPNEFLEALLGLKAQNWLNLFERVKSLTSFKDLNNELDTLAKKYIGEFTGKAFSELDNDASIIELKDLFNKVTTDYQNLENYAVAIFDRYYDPAVQKVSAGVQDVLNEITRLTSTDQLRGTVLGDKLADVIYLLTDGRPMDWLLSKIKIDGKELPSLETLQQRANNALSLIKDDAHAVLRKVITLAKSEFPLNKFLEGLKTIDPAQLNAEVDAKMTGFVERVIGQSIAGFSKSKLGGLVRQLNTALSNLDNLKNNLYAKLKQSLNQSFQFNLALAYNQNTENSSLLDVELNLGDPRGKSLMKAFGAGDFSKIFENYNPDIMFINEGALTHQVTAKSSVLLNIVGWHLNFKYQNIVTLLTKSEQCIRSEENGLLTVTTNFTMGMSRDMSRNGDRIYSNLVIGMAGASCGKALYDDKTKRYMVDVLTKVSGDYALEFNARNTSIDQLKEFLEYAVQFGIKKTEEEVEQAFLPTMQTDAKGTYGSVILNYQVRFCETGLSHLLTKGLPNDAMRRLIRQLTWSNYLNSGRDSLNRMGWCYWSQAVYSFWKQNQAVFYISDREFSPVDPAPVQGIPTPKSIILHVGELQILNTLYYIEESLIRGFDRLVALSGQTGGFSPLEYEQQMGDFQKALKQYDSLDESVNTLFAVFDAFIRAEGDPSVQASSLILKSQVDGQPQMTKILMS